MNPRELDVALSFIQQYPQAAARELELQTQETTVELLQTLPLRQGRQLITHMLPSYAARLCTQLSLDVAAGLLAEFNANQAAAILRGIPKPKRDDLLTVLPEKTAMLCRLLLSYSEDSVGAWMNADIVMLPPNCSVAEALQRYMDGSGSIIGDALPVVDSSNFLVGLVKLKDLLRAKAESSISHLRQPAPVTLSSRNSLAAAARNEGWRQQDILPVLNRNKQLVGLLHHVDLRHNLANFGKLARTAPQHDLLGNIGEAYISSLAALLGLIDKQQTTTGAMLGER